MGTNSKLGVIALLAMTISIVPRAAASRNDETSSTSSVAADNTDAAAKPSSEVTLAKEVMGGVKSPVPAAPAAKPQASAIKAEVPGITFGFDERFRFEGYNNADFNNAKHDRLNQLRMRTRPYVDINFNDYLEGYVRMGWEGGKRTNDPSYPSALLNERASPFMSGELWFDNAYLRVKKFPGFENLSLQAGRFEIIKGDGWLFSDPSGVDGSREGYDNAFDLAYTRGQSRFEFIGIYNPKYDEFFPVWNKAPIADSLNPSNSGTMKNYVASLAEPGKQLQEWDESAIGMYYTNRERKNTDIEAYNFFKKSYADLRKQTTYLYLPDRHYTLFGGRAGAAPEASSRTELNGRIRL